jgi:oligopeptide transport system substrate-binding protein
MQERGDLVQDETGRWAERPTLDWNRLPARVEAIVAERVSRLPAEWQATLAVASVEGEEFTAEVVAQVQGVAEGEIIRHLSGALSKQHRLVIAQSLRRRDGQRMSRYRFRHHLFQRYLYQRLDEVERAHLHEAVGKTLEALYGKDDAETAVHLARHFQEAGLMNRAVSYLLQAGDRARGLHAHQEAIHFYQQALAGFKETGAYQRAAQTLMKLGLTYHLAFDFPRARRAYEEGFVLWQQASIGQMAPLPLAPHPLRMTWYDPITLDPGMTSVEPSWMIIGQLFSGLVALNAELDVVPEVAQSWEVLEGGTQYIFHLRDDVRWSDGQPVTAEDFVYAWRRALDPALGSLNASYLFDIKGARSYHQGQVSDPICVGVQALDPVTLLVELEGPTSYFPQLLTRPPLYPVPRHGLEAHGDNWTKMKHLVTNGPFTLVRWERGHRIDLARNPGYRGEFTGNVQEVALTLDIPSPLEELAMYEADRLDAMSFSWFPEAALRRQWHSGEYFSSPMLLTLYLGFNVRRPPFDDPRVRQALAMAIDKEGLANAVLMGHSLPAMGGFLPPGMPGHAPSIGLPFDPERARCLLSEAGYPTGQNFPVVRCLRRSDLFKTECDYIRAQLHKNLGINAEWQTTKVGRVLERLDSRPPHLGLASWGVDYPDPDNPLTVGVHKRWTGWQNQNYTELLEQARRIINQAERIRLYQEADRILIEEAPVVPLLYGRHHLWVKPWVSKYPVSVIHWFFWKDVVIEPH